MKLPIDQSGRSNYSYYMEPVELKVARIGNSRGIRIPALTLERYRIGTTVVMEERARSGNRSRVSCPTRWVP